MRTLIIATTAAVVIALWLFTPKPQKDVSTASLAPSSYWDVHNQAHLEWLPVLHFEDLSVVFTESGYKQAPPARLVRDSGQRR